MAGVKSVVGTRQAPAQVDIEVYGSVAAAAGRASSRSRYSQLAVALGFVACVALLLAGARQPAAGTHPQALAESWGSWLEGVLDTPLGLGDAAHKQKVSQVLKASVVPLTNLAAQKGKKLNIVKGSSLKTWVATGVENYARACGPARDQPCSAGQSTTAFGGVAEKAVDNGNQTSYSEGSCTHTDTQNNPWWKVNIARQISVTGVRIVGRDDGVANRLQGFNVYVGNHNYEPDANAVCAQNQDAPAAPDYAVDVTCSTPLKGQYVYVTVPGENKILTLCEVQVHGNELPPDQGGFDPWGVSNQGNPRPDQLPIGASRNTWANIVNNKKNLLWCTEHFHYLGNRMRCIHGFSGGPLLAKDEHAEVLQAVGSAQGQAALTSAFGHGVVGGASRALREGAQAELTEAARAEVRERTEALAALRPAAPTDASSGPA